MKELEDFFKTRPITKAGVCREAGISYSLLKYIISGEKRLTDKVKRRLYPVLNKYGGQFRR